MSLVEKALRKLKASGAAEPASGNGGDALLVAEPRVERSETRRVAKPRAARTQIGTAPLVKIDLAALRAKGILPPESEERELADQYRTIKRPLLKNAFQPVEGEEEASPRSVMITSALPGDGKTFSAINLALSIARERDFSTMLVDADVAKRDVTDLLGLSNAPGLLDVLANPGRSIESVVAPTNVPGLSVLPAGTITDNATELLSSARMREVMDSLVALDPQCIVLLDSPPILLTTEAPVLASLFGQILMVVRAAKTPQQAVQEALRIIGPTRRVSLILNGADVVGPAGYQFGGYGYGYGYYRPAAEPENTGE